MSVDLASLLERVRKASGPDRRLDSEIACALVFANHRPAEPNDFEGKYGYSPGNIKCNLGFIMADPYTSSIDAAVALVARAKPGWFWRGGHVPIPHWDGQQYRDCWAHLSRTDASNCIRGDEATGWHDTVPLSIIDALLQAKIAEAALLSALDTGSGR